jgi:hypothetical protein
MSATPSPVVAGKVVAVVVTRNRLALLKLSLDALRSRTVGL